MKPTYGQIEVREPKLNRMLEDFDKDMIKTNGIYYKLNRVSKTGLTRWYSFYTASNIGGQLYINDITYRVCDLLSSYGYGVKEDNWSCRVSGCGFDGGASVIMDLSTLLYQNAYDIPIRRL